MPGETPAPGRSRRLPRGHLLTLNTSFRLTLEQEDKSPRTVEAYTDAVRLLAAYRPPTAPRTRRSRRRAAGGAPPPPPPRERGAPPPFFLMGATEEGEIPASPMD